MKSLYRGFMMVVAAVGLAVSAQAMAGGKVLIGAPGQQLMPKGAQGYFEVVNRSKYRIYVTAPEINSKTYELVKNQSAYFPLYEEEAGAYIYVSYKAFPKYATKKFVYDGDTEEIYDPISILMSNGKGQDQNANVPVNMKTISYRTHKAVA